MSRSTNNRWFDQIRPDYLHEGKTLNNEMIQGKGRLSNANKMHARVSKQSLIDDYIDHARTTITQKTEKKQKTESKEHYDTDSSDDYTKDNDNFNQNTNHRRSLRQSLAQSLAGVEVSTRLVNKFGSVKAVEDENERMEKTGLFVIHPYSNFRFVWDVLTLVVLLLNIILIPIFMAFPAFEFNSDHPKENQKRAQAAMVIRLLSDAWFAIDVAINFRTGIILDGSNSEIILDTREIRRRYLRGWFILDFLSTFPFDVAISTFTLNKHEADFGQSTMMFRYLRLTKLFKLLRLLRISRVWRYMHQCDEMFNLPYESAVVLFRMFTALLCLLMYAHLSACIQFMVPMIMGFPRDCWVRLRELHLPDTDLQYQYGWSFFRAVSQMLCIGYGQFPPRTLPDMWVTMMLMMMGAICFAVFIGYATSIVQSHNASKRLYAEKYSSVKHYMSFRKLPSELRKRISDYYENRFQGKMFNETQILNDLNPILREEIINHNCRELVDSVPFFSKADPAFVSCLVRRMKFEMYLYNDEIIREGTIGRKMYFISKGTVRVQSRAAKSHLLTDGAFFGEISLILPHLRRVASVFADSYCYLYTLTVDDFNDTLNDFPLQRQHFISEAGKRLDNMKMDTDLEDESSEPTSVMQLLSKRINAKKVA